MHACNLFEKSKVLIEPVYRHVGMMTPGNTTESVIAKTKSAIETTAQYRVIAIWRTGHHEGAWFDENVQTVSTGKQWGMFRDMLDSLGFPFSLANLSQ